MNANKFGRFTNSDGPVLIDVTRITAVYVESAFTTDDGLEVPEVTTIELDFTVGDEVSQLGVNETVEEVFREIERCARALRNVI